MTLRASTRAVPVAVAALALGAALTLGAAPAQAGPVAGPDVPVQPLPALSQPRSGVGVMSTIEDEEAWCGYLTGVYVFHPAYYSVRTINCRYTDVFVKPVYLNGTFGTCVLVPARHSRHLGGSVLKPIEESQIC